MNSVPLGRRKRGIETRHFLYNIRLTRTPSVFLLVRIVARIPAYFWVKGGERFYIGFIFNMYCCLFWRWGEMERWRQVAGCT